VKILTIKLANMKRLQFSLFTLLLLGLMCATSFGAEKPNILFLVADDMGIHIGCYGDKIAKTPNLDRLAASGIRFNQGYVTQASCSPSRSSMHTGLYPHQNGQVALATVRDVVIFEPVQTLPMLLKKAGYFTGNIGKVHMNPKEKFEYDFRPGVKNGNVNPDAAGEVMEKLFKDTGEKPFFLVYNFKDPHTEFKHQIAGVPAKPVSAAEVEPLPFQPLDTPAVRERTAGYYNGIMRADAIVGRILDSLESKNLLEKTLIVFVGDHGAPFSRGKTSCYEAGVKVPYLISWKGKIKPGQISEALVSTIDLLPTFLDAAGEPVPARVAGTSLRPFFTGETPVSWRKSLLTEHTAHSSDAYYPRRAVRDERYKLILNIMHGTTNPVTGIDGDIAYDESQKPEFAGTPIRKVMDRFANPPEFELYDLHSDPWEMVNLAGDPAHAETMKTMKGLLQEWRAKTEDPLLQREGFAAEKSKFDEWIAAGKGVSKAMRQKRGLPEPQ
jgi:N-sulfoglucosamine sulfohydrolase